MSTPARRPSRPRLAFVVGTSSLAAGSVSALMAGALVALAAAGPLGLLRGGGGRVADALSGPVLVLIWSHGFEPQPAWNHLPAMFSAIAGSPRVYVLPFLALVLGLIGRGVAGRGRVAEGMAALERAALRQSRGGIFLGLAAVALLLGLLAFGRFA